MNSNLMEMNSAASSTPHPHEFSELDNVGKGSPMTFLQRMRGRIDDDPSILASKADIQRVITLLHQVIDTALLNQSKTQSLSELAPLDNGGPDVTRLEKENLYLRELLTKHRALQRQLKDLIERYERKVEAKSKVALINHQSSIAREWEHYESHRGITSLDRNDNYTAGNSSFYSNLFSPSGDRSIQDGLDKETEHYLQIKSGSSLVERTENIICALEGTSDENYAWVRKMEELYYEEKLV